MCVGWDLQDAIGIDVEGYVDLRLASAHGWDAVEIELAQHIAVASHPPLALEDLWCWWCWWWRLRRLAEGPAFNVHPTLIPTCMLTPS